MRPCFVNPPIHRHLANPLPHKTIHHHQVVSRIGTMIPILSHSNANRSLVTSPPRTPTNQAIIPIGHRLAKNAPIPDQSENSCVSKRGTSVLCGPDRSVSTEDDPTDKETKTTRQSNVNPMQIKCQSANLPIQCQSYNNPPINRQFDNTSPIHQSYSNL